MFKWMISGHRSHKQKGCKLNNNTWNTNNTRNKNKRNLNNESSNCTNNNCKKERQEEDAPNSGSNSSELQNSRDVAERVKCNPDSRQSEQKQRCEDQPTMEKWMPRNQQDQPIRFAGSSHTSLLTASRDTLNDSNEYTTLDQLQPQKEALEKFSGRDVSSSQIHHSGLRDNKKEPPPPLPSSRQPFPITIGSQPNLNKIPSQQGLPPLPSQNGQVNGLPQAPGTCTLPRRSLIREDISSRYRSPSNPPPNLRRLPPHSLHQPPDTFQSIHKPCQPPTPPRVPLETTKNQIPQNSEVYRQDRINIKDLELQQQVSKNADMEFQAFGSRINNFYSQTMKVMPQLLPDQNIKEYHNQSICSSFVYPSKSTEDLLNASRVSNSNAVIPSQNLQCSLQKENQEQVTRDKESCSLEILLSDSIYPTSNALKSNRYETEADKELIDATSWNQGHSCNSQENVIPEPFSLRSNLNMVTFRPPHKEDMPDKRMDCAQQRYMEIQSNSLHESNHSQMHGHCSLPSEKFQQELITEGRYNDHSKSKVMGQNDTKISNSELFDSFNELYISEKEDDNEWKGSWKLPSRTHQGLSYDQTNKDKTFDNSNARIGRADRRKETYCDAADLLIVRDVQTFSGRNGGKRLEALSKNYKDEGVEERTGNRRAATSSSSWMEWTQQLQAYVAWVNSQLRKRPNQELVTDLRRDFQNGVIFADLIEIMAGERIMGIMRDANTPQLRRDNLDRVLQFMTAKRISMTHITSKEIAEGNLKSIMRVILALAAHYKPQSVRDGSQQHRTSDVFCPQKQATESVDKASSHDTGASPDCRVSTSEKTPCLIRRHNLQGGEDLRESIPLRRQPSLTHTLRPSSPCPVYENLPKRVTSNRWAYDSLRASHKFCWESSSPATARKLQERKTICQNERDSLDDSDINFTVSNLRPRRTTATDSTDDAIEGLNSYKTSVRKPAALDFWQQLQAHQDEVTKSTFDKEAEPSPFRYHTVHRISGRRKLPQIPGMSSPSSNNSRGTTPLGLHSGPPSDISQSAFEEALEHMSDRETSAGRISCEGRGTNGSVSDETSREPEGRSQNSSPVTSLVRAPAADSWRQIFALEKGLQKIDRSEERFQNEASVAELSHHILEKDSMIADLRKQLMQTEKALHIQRAKFDEAISSIQNGRPIQHLLEEIPVSRIQGREELHLVREAISSLRSNFRGTDPNQHTLDTLEQAIAVLMERVLTSSSASCGDHHAISANNKKDRWILSSTSGQPSTKVIYFTDKTVTPFMSSISKPLGNVTLRDFKEVFDRPGNFRFHFKNYDPEYGLVKEEILNDDDILPGVEGKVIAWVEEELD